jgi:hypothetical protein
VLEIVKCKKLNLSQGFQYLTCLERLKISSCPEVESLHDALQHMTSLQRIKLYDLPKLESLPDWLGNLSLLQTLRISLCPNLSCLLASIQCLSSLKLFHIERCPWVEKWCQKEIGEDWSKIAHVQHIEVQSKKLKQYMVIDITGLVQFPVALRRLHHCSVDDCIYQVDTALHWYIYIIMQWYFLYYALCNYIITWPFFFMQITKCSQ